MLLSSREEATKTFGSKPGLRHRCATAHAVGELEESSTMITRNHRVHKVFLRGGEDPKKILHVLKSGELRTQAAEGCILCP